MHGALNRVGVLKARSVRRRRVGPRAWIAPIFWALLRAPAAFAETQDELWPEAQAYFKLDPRLRVFLLAKLVYSPASWTEDGTSSYQEIETGPHLDITLRPILHHGLAKPVWERERALFARVGYVYISTLGDVAAPSHENRGLVELTGRLRLPGKLWLVNRAQLELRDKGGDFSTRYRVRFMLERETTVFGAVTTPFVNAEFFYDTVHDAWSRQRYEAGVEIVLDDRWRLVPQYAYQEDQRSEPRQVNAVGVILKHYR